jgi:hypothetical protein
VRRRIDMDFDASISNLLWHQRDTTSASAAVTVNDSPVQVAMNVDKTPLMPWLDLES